MTELQLLAKRQKYETSHILHLLVSVLTFGAWVPVWLIVALSNANERQKVDRKLKQIH